MGEQWDRKKDLQVERVWDDALIFFEMNLPEGSVWKIPIRPRFPSPSSLIRSHILCSCTSNSSAVIPVAVLMFPKGLLESLSAWGMPSMYTTGSALSTTKIDPEPTGIELVGDSGWDFICCALGCGSIWTFHFSAAISEPRIFSFLVL